jgi:ElaB/YqjD/DUF883 family membrane-anchored ribosome-binding protein
MDNEPEVTCADLDETRASLSEKLETLEQKVVHSVHGATSAVNETVESVKDAVHDTVATVKETFDLPLQVRRRPWVMVGGSIALGYLGGYLLRRRGSDRPSAKRWSQPAFPGGPQIAHHRNGDINGYRSVEEAPPKKPVQEVSQKPSEPGFLSGVHHQFEAEITKLKGLAIGTVLGVVRDLITQSGPEQMKAKVAEVLDSITVKLGGEPIRGPALKDNLRAKEEDNEYNASDGLPGGAGQIRPSTGIPRRAARR